MYRKKIDYRVLVNEWVECMQMHARVSSNIEFRKSACGLRLKKMTLATNILRWIAAVGPDITVTGSDNTLSAHRGPRAGGRRLSSSAAAATLSRLFRSARGDRDPPVAHEMCAGTPTVIDEIS